MGFDYTKKYVQGNNGIVYPEMVGNNYATITLNSSNGTTPVTIITGVPGYWITEMGVQVDDICTISVAGMVSTKFTDTSSGDMFVIRWYIPSAFSPKTGPSNNRQVSGPGFAWNNKVANSSLQVSVDTALTAGTARFFIRFAQTNFVG